MRTIVLIASLIFAGVAAAPLATAQVPYDSTQPGVISDVSLPPTTWSGSGPGRSFRNSSWVVLPNEGAIRSRNGGTTPGPLSKDFYVFGGETPTGLRVSTVSVWHRTGNYWTWGGGMMPRPVSNIMGSVVYNDGFFYVFGGLESGDMPIAEVQMYDPVLDSWSVVAQLPRPLFGVGAAVLQKDKIIVFGGSDLRYIYGDSWYFDAATRTFTAGPPMSVPATNISTTHWPNDVDGKIYFTGMNAGTFLQTYDDALAAFAVGPTFVGGGFRDGCGIASRGRRIMVWAGDWFGYRDDTETYNTAAGGPMTMVPGLLMNVGRRSFAYGDTRCPALLADDGFNGQYLDHYEGVR